MVYRDSTADGVEGSMLERGGPRPTDTEVEAESNRLAGRLAFLTTLARLWKQVAVGSAFAPRGKPPISESLAAWRRASRAKRPQARPIRWGSLAATDSSPDGQPRVARRIRSPHERQRVALRKSDRLVAGDGRCQAVLGRGRKARSTCKTTNEEGQGRGEGPMTPLTSIGGVAEAFPSRLWQAVLTSDEAGRWAPFLAAVRTQPLLYVRLAKGASRKKSRPFAACSRCFANCFAGCRGSACSANRVN